MKGKETKKEVKKEKSERTTSKPLSDYQREKQSKSDKGMGVIPKN